MGLTIKQEMHKKLDILIENGKFNDIFNVCRRISLFCMKYEDDKIMNGAMSVKNFLRHTKFKRGQTW